MPDKKINVLIFLWLACTVILALLLHYKLSSLLVLRGYCEPYVGYGFSSVTCPTKYKVLGIAVNLITIAGIPISVFILIFKTPVFRLIRKPRSKHEIANQSELDKNLEKYYQDRRSKE